MEISAYSKAYGVAALHKLFERTPAPTPQAGQNDPAARQNPPSDTSKSAWTHRSAAAVEALSGSVRLGAQSVTDLMKVLDMDGDGAASLAELQDAMRSSNRPEDITGLVAKIDANQDGAIDATELSASFATRAPLQCATSTEPPRDQIAGAIGALDQNGDQALDLSEITSAIPSFAAEEGYTLQTRFAALDANSDGKLDVEEFSAALQRRWEDAMQAYRRWETQTAEASQSISG